MREPRRIASVATLVFFLALAASPLRAAEISPPENGQFVQDLAGLISGEDAFKIQEQGRRLLSEHAIPLVVLTVDSMAEYGDGRIAIETFARLQFETWGHHPAFPYTENWRRGILLVVAREDRKARIELGAEWALEYDAQCERIMQGVLVPTFKQGFYSAGITDGTEALARMSRGESAGSRIPPEWFWFGIMITSFLGFFLTAHFLDRHRRAGDVVVGVVDQVSTHVCNLGRSYFAHRRRRYGGFGGNGGSFGGGGGATGSW